MLRLDLAQLEQQAVEFSIADHRLVQYMIAMIVEIHFTAQLFQAHSKLSRIVLVIHRRYLTVSPSHQ